MKTVAFRLPATLVEEIRREARARGVSKSAVVRDRLSAGAPSSQIREMRFDAIADLVGSVDGLEPDLSSRRKAHLTSTGYGRKRRR